MKTTLEILRDTRELLTEPHAWTQGEFARDRHYRTVPFRSRFAVCWCLTGAVSASCSGSNWVFQAIEAANPHIESLTDWNDSPDRKHEEVLAALDRTIKKEEAKCR